MSCEACLYWRQSPTCVMGVFTDRTLFDAYHDMEYRLPPKECKFFKDMFEHGGEEYRGEEIYE